MNLKGHAFEELGMLFPFMLMLMIGTVIWVVALFLKHRRKYALPFFYLSFLFLGVGGAVCLFVLIGRVLHF